MQDKKFLNCMRSVALQSIMNAGQGHTGMALSAIPLIYTLYTKNINISNKNSKWINRDRFILSAGHGSMSLYSLFFLSGLLTIEDMKNYRQEDSLTPGHPEIENNNFIDSSTGPLGQGIANAVGMAISELYLRNRWKKLSGLIDHFTYVVVGDGDLQEGVCYESMSIAGRLKLNKLIVLHDSNDFQLDSDVKTVNNENIKNRIKSQNWDYYTCDNNVININECIAKAKLSKKPSFIEVKTIIGEGTSASNNFKAHGLKVTNDELKNANKYFDMNYDNFNFSKDVFDYFDKEVILRGNNAYDNWNKLLNEYKIRYPRLVKEFLSDFEDNYNIDKFHQIIIELKKRTDIVPTKSYVQMLFELTNKFNIKNILTLSADLASTTNCKNSDISFNKNINNPYIMMGIREFSMGAIQNGILMHKGLRVFSGTFLVFADYIKPAIRVGCLCQLPSYYIFTHDSYLVGGDGPTHQPYDQIPMLRAIENSYIIRPMNMIEFANGLLIALKDNKSTYSFALTRQKIEISINVDNDLNKGAYLVNDKSNPDVTLIANGSEIEFAFKNIEKLEKELKININIVSCPILKLFLEQDEKYISDIIKSKYGIICLEASSDALWYKLSKYTKKMEIINATTFGKSMDGKKLYEQKGYNYNNLLHKVQELINDKK